MINTNHEDKINELEIQLQESNQRENLLKQVNSNLQQAMTLIKDQIYSQVYIKIEKEVQK